MNKRRYILSLLLGLLAVSCSVDDPGGPARSDEALPLVLYASISGTGSAVTRASRITIHDKWSYSNFEGKDVMGFYSSGGDWAADNGKGEFNNRKLTYDGERFTDEQGATFSPSHMSGSQVFMYFPYSESMNDPGLKLRQEEPDDQGQKTERCIDFLSSDKITLQGSSSALYGTFEHAFSELIIMRGKGFDNPPLYRNEADKIDYGRITAVLNAGFTHIKVNLHAEDDSWSCSPELVFVPSSPELSDEDRLEEELKARRWNVWKGGNYSITGKDEDGRDAWYVIVPTLNGRQTSVEYIELYDNEGYLKQVKSLNLSNNTKYLQPGWRYPMEITMEDLIPTVNPFNIVPWNGEVDLTDQRMRGIGDPTEFELWMQAYNAYLEKPDDPETINALFKYGDELLDAERKRSWHFYLLADLDLSRLSLPESSVCILPRFEDIIDGLSTTFVNGKFINHTISGLSKTFIGNMTKNGSVQNLDFISPNVTNSEQSTAPAGIIANSMDRTSVINCNIDNGTLFNPGGPAGMVVGSMNGGNIENCTLSGFLTTARMATGDAMRIAGEVSGDPTFKGNDADAVIDNQP